MDPTPGALAVAFYTGLNGLVLIWLAAHVGQVRAREGVLMGDGGNPALVRAMRGQANFVEYVPFCLVALVLMALLGTPLWVLHLFGLALTLGRVLHARHFTRADAPGWQRSAGAGLTGLVLSLASLGLIGHALAGML